MDHFSSFILWSDREISFTNTLFSILGGKVEKDHLGKKVPGSFFQSSSVYFNNFSQQ